ncbi:RING-H2 finger protein ATL2-like [Momordica charantia]|uniref:RING-H2 finger protein ATL2-like n=1 Tax=Momordica charantia TaxID=3673 RepID=A0A6J1E009_MOMCH|nr:RING-H2 finger protein ATL2-like [Momordica charantia]
MGFLYFAINGHRCSQILHFFTGIFRRLKHLGVYLGVLKPPPQQPEDADDRVDRPTSYVFVTEGLCPSLVTVPATDLQARIKKSLPIVEFGDFAAKGELKFWEDWEEEEEEEEKGRCTICLSKMEKSEKMRELSNCCHVFHKECLDTWIDEFQITCPICRSMLLPAGEGDGLRYFR